MQTNARGRGLGMTPFICVLASTLAAGAMAAEERALMTKADLSKDKVLYVVGYAHLDTQWRWDYATTIDEFVRNTLDDNFDLFARHPDYIFNFTGAARYGMMKEYYPGKFEKMKEYVRQGRWHVSGSSVDEGDVNVPSPESVIRQILYGNIYFRRELGVESTDYMLPDCFGFPASLPSVFAHCGLTGFSTQKLSWGSVAGVPFNIGVWEGPDGRGVVCALNPGDYAAGELAVGGQKTLVRVPAWTGFIGQFDSRVWAESFPRIDYRGANTMVGLAPGYIKRTPVAWFATHRHHPDRGNEAYRFSYLFQIELPLPAGSTELVLPQNEKIKIFAVTAARSERDPVVPAQPLYDDFSNRGPITLRSAVAH